jgi:hypothetical protein
VQVQGGGPPEFLWLFCHLIYWHTGRINHLSSFMLAGQFPRNSERTSCVLVKFTSHWNIRQKAHSSMRRPT